MKFCLPQLAYKGLKKRRKRDIIINWKIIFKYNDTWITILYRKGVIMSRVSRGFRITGNLLKACVWCVVAGVILVLLWRIFSSGTPTSLKALTPNAPLAEAYEENGGKLYMFKQDHQNVTTAARNYGYFGFSDYYIIPEANQIQIVFRYNNSTIRALAEDESLAEVPSKEAELFDVSLVLQTDLTPENTEDNGGNVEGAVEFTRFFPVEALTERKTTSLYNYFRYVFIFDEEHDLEAMLESGELLAIYADVYYNEKIDYDATSYGTLFLYDYKTDIVKERLTLRDKNAIKEYIKEENE